MKILFLCTAHNSLSQRLYLALKHVHQITIEYALSSDHMLSAVSLSNPDIILCPFLTTFVPKEIYDNYLTLIIHPGPPGDAGPSSIDWALLGDDGSVANSNELLRQIDQSPPSPGRTHWGVTVLQAMKDVDAGPVWAFDQFSLNIDEPKLTKSSLYRGPITRSAVSATLAALSRIQATGLCSPRLRPRHAYRERCVSAQMPFQGGRLHHRPLLKATQRDFDVTRHSAQQISRRIRCSDSQPGALSRVFGCPLFVYGGVIDDSISQSHTISTSNCQIIGCRNGAVCIASSDGKGVWITHVRQPKSKSDKALHPKVSAVSELMKMGILLESDVHSLDVPSPQRWRQSAVHTFQEVWVDMHMESNLKQTAYLHFDFYNGAMAADQCDRLIEAMDYIIAQSTERCPVQAVVLMGGAYFSNGIALNVIEASEDPALESWRSINRINDVVRYLLHDFPSRDIVTVAAVRGNAAAGGVALATACDVVIAGANVVLNPAYRAIGLSGSEYHTVSYRGRCGPDNARRILREMKPMSPSDALSMGLVDVVFPEFEDALDQTIRNYVSQTSIHRPSWIGSWKQNVCLSSASLARAREDELHDMALDFWSARSVRYHRRRFDFIRKVKPDHTPLRFAKHRRDGDLDEEESDLFDDVEHYKRLAEEQIYEMIKASLLNASEVLAKHSNTFWSSVTSAFYNKDSETMFSCYYNPPPNRLPTPPESPRHSDATGTTRTPISC